MLAQHHKLTAAIIVGILVTGLFGWALYAAAPPLSELKITRTSSGGLSGAGDGHDYRLSGSDLSADQLRQVANKLFEAQFFSTGRDYLAVNCADQSQISLDVRLGNKSNTVRFEDCGQPELPRKLVALDLYLAGLARH